MNLDRINSSHLYWENNMTKQSTERRYQPTYWNGEGEMQEIYDALSEALVPNIGEAPTKHGNALRWIGNIYHEVYNNGGWNAWTDDNYDHIRVLKPHYRDGIETIVEVANLDEKERRTLRNALIYGSAMCDGNRPLSSKRLDAIVTKVVKAVLLAHLATIERPANGDWRGA